MYPTTELSIAITAGNVRYIAGYVNGFHEHMPCLHVQTMTMKRCSIELILAMAAVGAQYCFEGAKGVELFHVSRAIAMHRIRRRDARLAAVLGMTRYCCRQMMNH